MTVERPNPLTTHDRCFDLLPWFANATLRADEHRMVREHLEACLVCRRELDEIHALREAVLVADDAGLAARRSLSTLIARIDAGDTAPRSANRSLAAWIANGFDRLKIGFGASQPAVRLLVGLQAALVVALGGALALTLWRPTPAVYETQATTSPANPSDQLLFSVRFRDAASDSDVRRAIESIGAQLVHGLSHGGVYTLSLEVPADRAARVRDAIAVALRSNPVVESVEPIRGAAPLDAGGPTQERNE